MSLQPFTAPSLGAVPHGFFTRLGGVSSGIYSSLNLGLGAQDDPAAIAENRARVCRHLAQNGEMPLVTAYQTHSTNIAIIDADNADTRPHADALITTSPAIAIGVLTADCVPILLADAQSGVVAAIHAGWRGAHAGIIGKVVARLCALGAHRHNVRAVIGPAISQAAYEVGAEFYERFNAPDLFMPAARPDHYLFDLPRFIAQELAAEGIATHNLDLCTYRREDLFFSYRRATHQNQPDYGRQISVIARQP